MNPVRADALVDLAYGGLIGLSIVLIATVNTNVGVAFGVGVFAAYVIHVVWKMARFDPDWMTRTVRETVEETVGDSVEETMEETVEEMVGDSVEETMEETVEETMGQQLDQVQARVESLDERIGRGPRPNETGDTPASDETTDDGRA
ncbi:DUF485 domain-containing protein [Halosimplex halophilum]|uniref:hypothetical protein n=1 Tax=Halosimplex halophilum TaxID=2559572 RepID=UPI001FEABC2B|nr:hypothetical protein [Halosimplex halophilum]